MMKNFFFYLVVLGHSYSLHAAYSRGAVLAFTIKDDGKAYFLLGKEKYGSHPWDDFGGGLNKNETKKDGAYREGSEESKLIFGKIEQKRRDLVSLKFHEISSLLKSSKEFILKHQWNVLKTGTYRIIIQINCIDSTTFNNAQTANKSELNEKSDYKWFPAQQLLDLLPQDKTKIDKHLTYQENNKSYLISRYFARDLFELRARGLADQILALEKKDEEQNLKKLFESLQDLTENLQVLQAFLLSISE